jgi:hypothetical protein
MATVTLGNTQTGQPEQNHVGINIALCHVSLSISLSVGDVHRIGKIPNNAIPLDWVWYPGSAFAATGIAKFGTSASQELFLASDSYAESGTALYRNIKKAGVATQVSISDDVNPQYEFITMVGTAGISIGHVGDLVVYYRMPGQTL